MHDEDPYQILGLDPEADVEAIRHAYGTAVRRCPPERDPDGFSRVRRAYELLRDPARRGAWDVQHAWGGSLAHLVEEALELEGLGKHLRAGALLKRALVLAPGYRPARLALARSLRGRGRHRDAVRELDRMLRTEPEDEELLLLAAQARRLWAEAPAAGPVRNRRLFREARSLLDRAYRSTPAPGLPLFLERVRLHLSEGLPERALEILEAAAPLPGFESDEDAQTLALGCQVHLDRRDQAAFRHFVERLEQAELGAEARTLAALGLAFEARKRALRGEFSALPGLIRAAEAAGGEDQDLQMALEAPRDVVSLLRERQALPLEMTEARRLVGLEMDYVRLPSGLDKAVLNHWIEVANRFRALDPTERGCQSQALRENCPTFCRRNVGFMAEFDCDHPEISDCPF